MQAGCLVLHKLKKDKEVTLVLVIELHPSIGAPPYLNPWKMESVDVGSMRIEVCLYYQHAFLQLLGVMVLVRCCRDFAMLSLV